MRCRSPLQRPTDAPSSPLLLQVAASGLALLALKGTPALAVRQCVHLSAVLALFATMPYGTFTHGVYRAAAWLKWSIEKRQPSRLRLHQHSLS